MNSLKSIHKNKEYQTSKGITQRDSIEPYYSTCLQHIHKGRKQHNNNYFFSYLRDHLSPFYYKLFISHPRLFARLLWDILIIFCINKPSEKVLRVDSTSSLWHWCFWNKSALEKFIFGLLDDYLKLRTFCRIHASNRSSISLSILCLKFYICL